MKFIRIVVKRADHQLICLIYTISMADWKTDKSKKTKPQMWMAVCTHAVYLYNNDFDVSFIDAMYKLEQIVGNAP